MATTTLYGIKNCDTVKKARACLHDLGIDYDFHDYKVRGVTPGQLADWCDRFGWERVINRAGTTFRRLDPAEREPLDRSRAVALMLAQPSLIKRPILEHGDLRLIGFDLTVWQAKLA